MTGHSENKPPQRRILRIASVSALVLLALVALYATAGFVLAPRLIEREIPRVGQYLERTARVSQVSFNPFRLVVRARGFVLEDSDGRPLLAVREAVADFDWRSIQRRGWVISELRLTEPAVRVEISPEGRLNLATLLPAPADASGPTAAPRFEIGRVAIAGGSVDFSDEREGYRNRIESVSLELSAISTLDPKNGPYVLAARTSDGAELQWNGELALQPLVAAGVLALRHGTLAQLNPYLDEALAGRITSGRVDIELPYRLSIADGKAQLEVRDAKVSLQEVGLALREREVRFATLERADLEGLALDLRARRVSARALRVGGLALAATRDADGALDLAEILIGRAEGKAGQPPWQIGIDTVSLDNGRVSFSDGGSGVELNLAEVTATLTGVDADAAKPLNFEVDAAVANGGRVALKGKMTPQARTLEARLEASKLPFVPLLQPFIPQQVDLRFTSGELALEGELTLEGEAGLSYRGAATAANVTIDDADNTRLLSWEALSTRSLRVAFSPARVEADELRWVAPAGRLAIAADGTTNLGRLFPGKSQAAPADRSAGSSDVERGTAVTVRRVRVEQGRLDFSDDSITPGFAARIHELSGAINGVSTDRRTRSQLALEGRVDEHGYARLSGTLNAFEPSDRTDIRVQFRNLDVASVSPYTVKFAGYRVASGRMSLDLRYRVRARLLEGDNQIVLEQFTLGERVDSASAPKVPLDLAVALLKDANGVIDVAVPISGNLDDPQFDFGALIGRAIRNLITSVISAPFRALARLFGGESEALGAMAFEPGSSRLLPPEREKIKRIVGALAMRPQLKVVVPARYDAEADARALRRSALRREIAQRAGFDVADDDPPGPPSIDDQRTRDALRGLFAERFSAAELERLKAQAEARAKQDGKPVPDIPVLERLRKFARGEPQLADATEFYRTLVQRLAETQPVPAGALEDLAQKRAAAVAAAFREAGVESRRIDQSRAEPAQDANAKQVLIELALAPLR